MNVETIERPPISNPAEAEDVLLRNAAAKRAMADPLPGPLAKAFCSGPITVGSRKVRKLVPYDWVAFKAIDSPVLSIIQDVIQDGKVDTEMPDEEAWVLVWILTHEPEQIAAMIDDGGSDALKRASKEVGMKWDAAEFNACMLAVWEQFHRHLSTAIKFGSESMEKGDITFFRDSGMPQKEKAPGGFSDTLPS